MVGFVDETFRDGPQSLWATRMRTATMLGGAEWVNRAGFNKVCVTSGAAFETAVRFLGENPWDRLRLLRAHLPDANLEVLIRSRNLFGWAQYPDDVVELLFRCLRDTGTDWLKVFDGLNDFRNIAAHFAIARHVGLKSAGMIAFSLSPVHTDRYFAGKAAELVGYGVDTVMVADASGLMTAERSRSMLGAIKAAIGDVPLEFYAHHSMGLAHEAYREAIGVGAATLTVASRPLANGESVPATRDIAAIARSVGAPADLDIEAIEKLDDYLTWAAYQEGRPVPAPAKFHRKAYDAFAGHQIPGGMISNFRNQLRELGLIHRLREVLEEASRVRMELGYPVMVTPFSQFVGVQATMNVIQGERYKTIPNELVSFVRGTYGSPAAPIDQNVKDRVLNGASLDPINLVEQYARPMLGEFARTHGPFGSHEDLLLHLFYGRDHVAAMYASGVVLEPKPVRDVPLAALIKELLKTPKLRSVRVERPGAKLQMRLARA
ncbi:MAG: hypothetical protein F9K29_17990 [Hyphomicrobiaceae bacterium]|nr:MAG: hypothetical protein F9K29_17990 [Hyphomicrobiaceae bacterium]